MSSKNVVNVAANQPVKKHWIRHILAFIVLTVVALAVWMIYTSLIHKAV